MAKSARGVNPRGYFYQRMRKHFAADPATLVLVSQRYQLYDWPNVHLALQKLFSRKNVSAQLEGILVDEYHQGLSLARLSRPETARQYIPGPVEYRDVEVADGKRLSCVERGLYWVNTPTAAIVLLISQTIHVYPPAISIEMMAITREAAEDFGQSLGALIAQAPAFRGHVLSLELDCHRQLTVRFHRLPDITREEIILPAEVVRRIDRQTVGMVHHARELRQAGRHLKRGVLLHGPPGTGKTLSAMYLASQMPGRTVLILTGGGISSIETSGILARALAPVTVILEDVDLIGTMRENQEVGANALLFELLNQMDGLAEDADVLYVLTTNRPDVLEPALAARPGRIDQAIEIPLPDEQCRRRLIDLYGKGIDLRLKDHQSLVAKTKGVSAAFMRELLRRATLLALEPLDGQASDGQPVRVEDHHVDAALEELMVAGGRLTQTLLGVAR